MANSASKEKSTVFSIRIKESFKEKLELESELQNINLNTLVNQILTKYLQWDRFGKDMGSVYITKRFLRGMFTELTEPEIVRLAKTISGPSFRDAVIFMHSELNYENIITVVKDFLDNSNYQFRHSNNGEDKFIIHHSMGKNWPQYFMTMLDEVLEETSHAIKPNMINDESMCFTIINTSNSE